MTYTETEEKTSILEQLVSQKDLIVYNDDFNTFDFVIESLVKVCKHDNLQAEQCTWIIHHNGKCQVKRGEFKELKPMCTALLERGITAEIE
ncbi:MAG: ATP-dependent Clp protease adaptor ClpS [Crocinitomicaceae bacterium]|jgi:ATP-dependent Clp protease adaptor protein ClpS|nr:ATP-dependent Clp protease adaptor ClpS [Crocinitomicaceae bacterium]